MWTGKYFDDVAEFIYVLRSYHVIVHGLHVHGCQHDWLFRLFEVFKKHAIFNVKFMFLFKKITDITNIASTLIRKL